MGDIKTHGKLQRSEHRGTITEFLIFILHKKLMERIHNLPLL